MGGEYNPHALTKEDGDVISEADFESIEGVLPRDPEEIQQELDALLDEEASRAAMGIVDGQEAVLSVEETTDPEPEEIDIEDVRNEALLRTYEAEYDRVAAIKEDKDDKSVDSSSETLQMATLQEKIDGIKQHILNRKHIKKIQETERNKAIADIEGIANAQDRTRAMRTFLASQRVKEERRGRRY